MSLLTQVRVKVKLACWSEGVRLKSSSSVKQQREITNFCEVREREPREKIIYISTWYSTVPSNC